MSRRQLPTLRGVYDGNDRYVRRSSEKVSYETKAQPRYRRRYVTRGKKKEVRHREHEGGRERNPFVEEGDKRFFVARVFVGEGEWGVCPKGEWWSLGTVGPSSP